MTLARRITQLERRTAAEAAFPPVPPLPLRDPADVVDLLAEQAEAVRQDPHAGSLDRARTLAVVASLALRAMDAATGRARVEALERALKARADQQRAEAKRRKDAKRY
ncbi:MAG: hypothetical protein JWO31_3910 [Phycisphaerales bacterium]|nr:hypothetical protein [Phycisphaerales bacterium]